MRFVVRVTIDKASLIDMTQRCAYVHTVRNTNTSITSTRLIYDQYGIHVPNIYTVNIHVYLNTSLTTATYNTLRINCISLQFRHVNALGLYGYQAVRPPNRITFRIHTPRQTHVYTSDLYDRYPWSVHWHVDSLMFDKRRAQRQTFNRQRTEYRTVAFATLWITHRASGVTMDYGLLYRYVTHTVHS